MRISRLRPSLLLLAAVSALAWSLSAGAAVLKLVQTGTVTMNASSPFANTATITSVDPTRTFVVCHSYESATTEDPTMLVTCELTNATTLTITSNFQNSSQLVSWYVVEFLSGVSVQRGLVPTATFDGSTTTVDVTLPTAVVLAKSFVLTSERMNNTGTGLDHRWTTTAQLTSTTNLRLTRADSVTSIAVAWQVIQIESASVQSGTSQIIISALSSTATLATPVDTTRTFLVFSRSGGTGGVGVERRYQTTGEITNATTLTFTRAFQSGSSNDTVDIAWYAVRMTDGTTVQRGLDGPSGTASSGVQTRNVAISAITINRSVPFISVRGDVASSAADAFDDTMWKTAFTTTTNLELTRRGDNATNATVAWQVVQFVTTGSSWWPNVIDPVEIFP